MLVSQRRTKGKKRPMSQHGSHAEELFSLGLLVLCWSSSNWTRRTGRAICSTQSTDSRELALGRQAAGGHWTLLDMNSWGHPHSRPDSSWKNLPEREHAQHRRARSWRALVTAFPAGSHRQGQVRPGRDCGSGFPTVTQGQGWSWDGGLPDTNLHRLPSWVLSSTPPAGPAAPHPPARPPASHLGDTDSWRSSGSPEQG